MGGGLVLCPSVLVVPYILGYPRVSQGICTQGGGGALSYVLVVPYILGYPQVSQGICTQGGGPCPMF